MCSCLSVYLRVRSLARFSVCCFVCLCVPVCTCVSVGKGRKGRGVRTMTLSQCFKTTPLSQSPSGTGPFTQLSTAIVTVSDNSRNSLFSYVKREMGCRSSHKPFGLSCVYRFVSCPDDYSSVQVPGVGEELRDARLHCRRPLLPSEREWIGSCSSLRRGSSSSSLVEPVGSLVVVA